MSAPHRRPAAAECPPPEAADMAALIGSRICHDLISPLGAIGNGVELMSLTGAGAGQELSLISESACHAQARIRFYRIAFGTAAQDAQIARAELRDVIAGMWPAARFHVAWDVAGPVPRPEAKLAFLLLMCTEAALPRGGLARVVRTDRGGWRIEAHGEPVRPGPGWAHLTGQARLTDPAPADVQFLLAAPLAAALGRPVRMEADADTLQVEA